MKIKTAPHLWAVATGLLLAGVGTGSMLTLAALPQRPAAAGAQEAPPATRNAEPGQAAAVPAAVIPPPPEGTPGQASPSAAAAAAATAAPAQAPTAAPASAAAAPGKPAQANGQTPGQAPVQAPVQPAAKPAAAAAAAVRTSPVPNAAALNRKSTIRETPIDPEEAAATKEYLEKVRALAERRRQAGTASAANGAAAEHRITLEQAGIAGMDPSSVRFASGRVVPVGSNFPSGERLLSVDPMSGRIVTDQRVILVSAGH